jgi:protein-S-isoprenylcysteine O-methyltransferase Ste14
MKTFVTRFALFVVIAALIMLGASGNLISTSPFVIAIQVLAVGLSVWARASFPSRTFRIDATPASSTMIRQGPYRFIRHPMYSAVLLFIWSAVFSHLGLWTLVLLVVVTAVVASRIAFEEQTLQKQYPDYAAFVNETKAVIPFLL